MGKNCNGFTTVQGVDLNIPPFMEGRQQLSVDSYIHSIEEDYDETRDTDRD